jgi:hypothetical protein
MTNSFGRYEMLPPPLTPPHKGEGKLPHAKSPSPLWGGVRGGGSSKNFFRRDPKNGR